MSIRLECDCGKTFRVAESSAGRRVRCPECDRMLRVPDAGEPEEEQEEESPRKRKRKAPVGKGRSRADRGSGNAVLLWTGLVGVILLVALVVGVVFLVRRGGPVGSTSVDSVWSQLRVGMARAEVDKLFGEWKKNDGPLCGDLLIDQGQNCSIDTMPAGDAQKGGGKPLVLDNVDGKTAFGGRAGEADNAETVEYGPYRPSQQHLQGARYFLVKFKDGKLVQAVRVIVY